MLWFYDPSIRPTCESFSFGRMQRILKKKREDLTRLVEVLREHQMNHLGKKKEKRHMFKYEST